MFTVLFHLFSVWFSIQGTQTLPIIKIQPAIESGYKISVKVNAFKDSTCYLAHHYGQYNSVDDTAKINTQGIAVFDGKEPLPGGSYIVVFPGKKYFEFIINKEQIISFETDTADLTKYMKVKGSNENKLFFDYLNYVNAIQKNYDVFKKRMENNANNQDSLDKIKKEITVDDNLLKDYKNNFNFFLASGLLTTKHRLNARYH